MGKGNAGNAETVDSQKGQGRSQSDRQLQSLDASWAVCSNPTDCSTVSVFAGKAAADVLVIEKLRVWLSLRAEHDTYSFSPAVV